MPDEQLQAAMEEIKPILKRFDCAAVVILASRTHMEYLHAIEPSWSAAWFEDGAPGVKVLRLRAMGADFPSKEAHKQCLEDTVGMLIGFGDACEHTQHQMAQAAAMIGKHFEVRHVTKHEGGTKGVATNPVQEIMRLLDDLAKMPCDFPRLCPTADVDLKCRGCRARDILKMIP